MALDLESFAIGKKNGSGGGGDVEVKPLTVKANGVYSDLGNVAYKPVRVQVPTYPEPTGTTTITTNGTHDVKNYAEAEVNIPEREILLQDKTATENGTYTADEGYDGIGEITVNVEGGEGEGYSVSSVDNGDGTQTLQIDDGFFPTETMLIESNGEYDVAHYGKVEVDVKGGGNPIFSKWEAEEIMTTTSELTTRDEIREVLNQFWVSEKYNIYFIERDFVSERLSNVFYCAYQYQDTVNSVSIIRFTNTAGPITFNPTASTTSTAPIPSGTKIYRVVMPV